MSFIFPSPFIMTIFTSKHLPAFFLAIISFVFSSSALADSDSYSDTAYYQTNPINEVTSGSIIYYFPSSDYLTQVALGTKVQMDITGTINRVRVEQTFTNPSNEWVEGVYVFPLPEDSAVDHLTMHIGDRVLEGQIKERQEAKQIYEQAKKEGKKASLIEQQRPNIFTTSVANIPPGESITIAIEYQQAVMLDNDVFSIRFPMVVGKRYVPGRAVTTPIDSLGWAPDTDQVRDASKVTPPSDPYVDRPISIAINLKPGFEPDFVSSSYHGVNIVDIDKATKHITLASDNVQAERDFELTWQSHSSMQPEVSVFTQKTDDAHYLMLMATPPKAELYKADSRAREVIYIIDSSGSMAGSSIAQAKLAIAEAIQSLNASDRFNVIDFDDEFEPLFKSAMPAIEVNKRHALRFIGRLDANGGTEPLGAINFALHSKQDNSDQFLRQIIFITDGQVANEDAILYNVRRFIGKDRMFTIGIGSAPNSFLMTRLADYGKGAFTYIGSTSEVKSKMQSLFNKLTSPALTDIQFSIEGGIQAEQARSVIPDLYVGETIVAAFKMGELPSSINIKGTTIYGNYNKNITIAKSNQTIGIDTLWARRKIEGLMNQYREMYQGYERDSVRADITKLALDHHLVSKFTSLVAVDVSPSKPSNERMVSKPVVTKVKAPQTATNSTLLMLLGSIMMIIALTFRRIKKI